MNKVKWGIIGIGWFGEYHGDALAGLPNVEIYSLCTRNKDRLAEVGKKFGVTRLYTDYNEMLADPELDAVSVTTMWDQHTGPTLAAIEAGKHVFLEKPMASTVADCRAIVEAANASAKNFMVGHIVRFNPRYCGGASAKSPQARSARSSPSMPAATCRYQSARRCCPRSALSSATASTTPISCSGIRARRSKPRTRRR